MTEPVLSRRALLLRGAGAAASVLALGRLAGTLEKHALAALPLRPSVVTREEPLLVGRRLAAAWHDTPPRPAPPFTLLGLHWQGDDEVAFRVRNMRGAWGDWERAHVHELPDPGGPERGIQGWGLGTPVWTGAADAVQYRFGAGVRRLRAHFVWSPPGAAPRRLATASQPAIVPRASWGADETIVRGTPTYVDRLRFAVVHHTAGASPSSPGASAAIVRAIQAYHVRSNGWNDVGYNFLVDPFGQVFEGRAGGTDRNVVGAHALGYNTGSVGVALLGNFEQDPVAPEAIAALVSLLAWRLDVGHVDPLALVTAADGRVVRAVSGHRDVNATACPGASLYPQLDAVAQQVAALGLPKLYDPLVQVGAGRAVRVTGRLSDARPWSIAVADASGAPIAGTQGVGPTIDWTWDAQGAPDGSYRWTIASTPDVLPASGTVTVGTVAPAGGGSVAVPPPPPPARPGGLPRRIPAWAWELLTWQRLPKASRGPRPAGAPRPLPRWYWRWATWQNALLSWQRRYK